MLPQVGYEVGWGVALATETLCQGGAAARVGILGKLCNGGLGVGWLRKMLMGSLCLDCIPVRRDVQSIDGGWIGMLHTNLALREMRHRRHPTHPYYVVDDD